MVFDFNQNIVNRIRFVLAFILLLLVNPLPLMADHGPLHASNRFPLFWMFLSPGMLPAEQPRQGQCDSRLALDYSSLHFDFHNEQWMWLMDMETTIVAISCTYGISDRWSMGVELPLIAMNSGFLDVFLEGFHNTLNVPNYGRELRPHNAYAFVVENNGETWIEGDSGQVAPADTTFFLSYQLTRRPSLKTGISSCLTLGLQLPTGSRQQGYGSGSFDVGLYLPMQWDGKRTGVFMMPAIHSSGRIAQVTATSTTGIRIIYPAVFPWPSMKNGMAWCNWIFTHRPLKSQRSVLLIMALCN